MAATYGRLTGHAGVCMATLGPGATNLVTPAAYAQLGAFPLVMITGQKPIMTSKQGRFQIVDVVRLMEPVTKMSRQIVHGNAIPSLVREAFRIAEEERPGAVLLELPEDIAAEESSAPLFAPHARYYAVASDKVIEAAAQIIRAAKCPLVLIGAGATRKDARQALCDFVHAAGIPFFDTQMGKGVVDERSPLFLGTAALSDGDYLHCAIDRADMVIRKGFRPGIDSYSAFFENDHATPTGLEGYLRGREIEAITLCGLATDFCVAYSALDAARLGFRVRVVEAACRAIDLDGSLAAAWARMDAVGVERA